MDALLEQPGVDETKECPQEIVQLDGGVEQQNDQQNANDELIVELLHGAHSLGRICRNKPTAVDPVSFDTWEGNREGGKNGRRGNPSLAKQLFARVQNSHVTKGTHTYLSTRLPECASNANTT